MKQKLTLILAFLALVLGVTRPAYAQKIIDLNAVTGAAATPSTDVMAISTAAGTTNKITLDELKIAFDLTTSPTFLTSLQLGTAGVLLSDDGDGGITFLGLGNGSDEDFHFNLDDTSNTIVITSTTGVTLWDFGTAIGLATGDILLNAAKTLSFEGATADAFETTITVVDPTGDRVWTIPDAASDTFAGLAATQSLSNKTLVAPIIDAAGVQFTGDGDGAVTLLGLGNGSDEDLVINLDDVANTIGLTSTTGVTALELGTAIGINSGDILINTAKTLSLEGATADGFETTLTVTDPTADRTWTFGNVSDTVAGTTAVQTLTNKTLTSPIVGTDITLGTAGVSITDDGDGAITFLGLGNGSDEDLKFNFDDTANTVSVTSGTGVSLIDFGSISLGMTSPTVATSLILGVAGVVITPDGDGAITILGAGNGTDEDLVLNFDDTSNTIGVSSTTSVSAIDFGTAIGLNTGTLHLNDAKTVEFEGSTADDFETTITVTDPTADRTWTLPNVSDTVVGLAATQSLSNKTLTSPVIATGLTASGSAANTFAGSTGTFLTSTGINTFGGSAHNFSAVLQPTTDDAAALGTTLLGFSDLFLATGGTLHFANTDWVATHTAGILTVGTGDLRVTTAGTNTASVATVGGTQSLTAKTLVSPVISTGLTASGSAANTFAGSTGTFITSTGVNTFKGSAHNFDAVLQPTTNDAAALGTTTLGFSDLHLATGATLNVANGDWLATHTAGILTVGTGDVRVTTAGTNTASVVTVGGTQVLTAKTLTAPIIGAAGVSLTGDGDGAVTLLGLGNGSDEDLTINLDDTANTVALSSSTGVTSVDFGSIAVKEGIVAASGDGAITILSSTVMITKGSAAALSVAAPSSQNGTRIRIISTTDFAHVITFTGGTLADGTTGLNTTVTMTAFAGSAITVVAHGVLWYVESQNNLTSIAP